MYMYICTCDKYACTHQCVCIQKVCATYICSIYFSNSLWWFWCWVGFFFCLNPLSAFSIPAGYDTHSFVFRSPRTRTERCVQSTKCISRKKDKKKSNITKANCLHHLSPRPPQEFLAIRVRNVPQCTSSSYTNVIRQCQAYQSSEYSLWSYVYTYPCTQSECQLIPWLQLSQALTWMHSVWEVTGARLCLQSWVSVCEVHCCRIFGC